jgi:hydrogenase maturation protease
LIAYGNPSRQDDGLAYHVILALRDLLGLELVTIDELQDGELLPELQVCFTQQLVPEMAEMLAEMSIVVFMDAHVPGTDYQPVHWQEIEPLFRPSMVSHHFKPEVLIAWCSSLYGHTPQAFVLSVLGTAFDFGTELSPEANLRARQAAQLLNEKLCLLPG